MRIPDEKLEDHFWLSELCKTQHRGVDNTPDPIVIQNLRKLASVLETIRHNLNDNVLDISSGYRCPALNAAVGSKTTSAHLFGLAADFVVRSFGTPLDVANAIAGMNLQDVDQIIHEQPNPNGSAWVHLGLAKPGLDPRHQLLTIDSHGTRLGLHEIRPA